MKFSVLMSVYYKEKSENLRQALDSIVNQTLKPNEIVLVEDGSLTDELYSVIKEYKKKYKYLKTVKLKENVGLGKALNEGLKKCKYDYVARMDSDDISVIDRFEKQVKYIKENPSCDLLGGSIIEFDSLTGQNLSCRIVPCNKNNIIKYLKKRNPFNHVTVMFRKSSVIESGGYQDCPYFEDYYLWARMIKKNRNVNNLNEILVKVSAGLEMTGRRGNIQYIKHVINFEKKLLKLNLINKSIFCYNVLIRSIVSIMPNNIRYKLYQRRLRNEKN